MLLPWQVNLAIILDGSGSINSKEFTLEQGFAEDTVAAFAARNLFENGGEASYVQYSSKLVSSGTFSSAQEFMVFSAADVQSRRGTNTAVGINEGRKLLSLYPHLALPPALALMSLVLGLNLLADGLREESLKD